MALGLRICLTLLPDRMQTRILLIHQASLLIQASRLSSGLMQ
ncbi:hypothetical protein SLEP1_g6636 [Rubroshorea leprosula]|uniref:Uncharacterized protein n=1 Tax=Rubroshorea leprosula TaxID=152421 RepID=A0AAV5HW57_9ROSI|nr:hypothetical protein SLEP1_g6636 [Rubroshorea leprosula]